jgi:hypothetical protein
MTKSPATLYRKNFSSRYELSREHQILEYLGQRQASVPPVVMSHTEMAYLDMHHGGLDLKRWLDSPNLAQTDVIEALCQALKALITTAQLDVWHFDVALRNFVIHNTSGASKTVWLIDFGNAVCPHFSLQKPLWMRPHDGLHSALQKALTDDWQRFHERHQLVLPSDWRITFDVPHQSYQDDWTSNLAVEAIQQKWCVIAHASGQMLLSAARLHPVFLSPRLTEFHALLNLQDETLAQDKLMHLAQSWSSASAEPAFFDHEKTPRPRAFIADSPSPQLPVAATPAQHPTTSLEPAIQHERKPSQLWHLGAAGIFIAAGWWVIDIAYDTQRQALSILSTSTLIALCLTTVGGLLGLLRRAHPFQWLVGSLWTHVFGQSLLIFELWVFGMKMGALWVLSMAPLLALLALARHHSTQKPTGHSF